MATADAKTSLYKDAINLASRVSGDAKHYLKVMEKVVNGTEGYVEKEAKRLVLVLFIGYGRHVDSPRDSFLDTGWPQSLKRALCRQRSSMRSRSRPTSYVHLPRKRLQRRRRNLDGNRQSSNVYFSLSSTLFLYRQSDFVLRKKTSRCEP